MFDAWCLMLDAWGSMLNGKSLINYVFNQTRFVKLMLTSLLWHVLFLILWLFMTVEVKFVEITNLPCYPNGWLTIDAWCAWFMAHSSWLNTAEEGPARPWGQGATCINHKAASIKQQTSSYQAIKLKNCQPVRLKQSGYCLCNTRGRNSNLSLCT